MKHILLIGVGPLPCYESNHLYGFGIRAWQFALPLLADGHRITLVTCEFGVSRESDVNIKYRIDPASLGPVEHIALPEPSANNMQLILTRIEEIVNTHKLDAIAAAGSTIATNLASLIRTNLPVWMDMFGDLFAEVQAKAPFITDDSQIEFFHRTLVRILLRGDRFSTVSEIQKGAAVGQMGLMGRLNRYNLGKELIWSIPCAIDGNIAPVKREPILRGKKVSKSDFLLLCSGGFNTWADVETLFAGIEGAMRINPRVHCVVTGGEIAGHHEAGFNRFRSLVAKSTYESQFHLLGWLSNQDVAQVTLECDLGMNVDLPIYESLLGSRNRMLFWMQCKLPILTTVTTEISRILQENGLALCVPTGRPEQITTKIIDAVQNPSGMAEIALQAQRFVLQQFSFEETTKPLRAWVENPEKAPDNNERAARKNQPLNSIDSLWQEWANPEEEDSEMPSLSRSQKPVIHTRPYGKPWWNRLLGK